MAALLIDVPYDKALALINLKCSVVLLTTISGDPLCNRTKELLRLYAPKYINRGFHILGVDANDYSPVYGKLACTRVPKIRVYVRGICKKEITGVPSPHELERLVGNVFGKY